MNTKYEILWSETVEINVFEWFLFCENLSMIALNFPFVWDFINFSFNDFEELSFSLTPVTKILGAATAIWLR